VNAQQQMFGVQQGSFHHQQVSVVVYYLFIRQPIFLVLAVVSGCAFLLSAVPRCLMFAARGPGIFNWTSAYVLRKTYLL